MNRQTPQEEFWANGMGGRGGWPVAACLDFLAEHISLVGIHSAIDVGAGQGQFLQELHARNHEVRLAALEIHAPSATLLAGFVPEIHVGSVISYNLKETYDLVMADGVLSCIPPEHYEGVIRKLCVATNRYLLIRDYITSGETITWQHADTSMFTYNHLDWIARICPELELVASAQEQSDRIDWLLFRRRHLLILPAYDPSP